MYGSVAAGDPRSDKLQRESGLAIGWASVDGWVMQAGELPTNVNANMVWPYSHPQSLGSFGYQPGDLGPALPEEDPFRQI
ncbi:MAG: hypothetical protein NZ765_10425 [Anaerolineae bacterium]|nr:hypothetical protein [Anaerolineae bacterium]